MSHVTCHVSSVTILLLLFFDGASPWRVCYQRGLPRLVFKFERFVTCLTKGHLDNSGEIVKLFIGSNCLSWGTCQAFNLIITDFSLEVWLADLLYIFGKTIHNVTLNNLFFIFFYLSSDLRSSMAEFRGIYVNVWYKVILYWSKKTKKHLSSLLP